MLVDGVRGGEGGPGVYRTIQNFVTNSLTREIIYKPPPPQDVPPLMQELVSWIRGETEIHPVLVAGIAQFQLVHIHPFLDGNGRTSRLLSTLCLYRSGDDIKRLFTLSEYYDRDRSAFYRALQGVREKDMDLTGWLEFFVEGLATQFAEVKARGQIAIRKDVLIKKHRLNDRQAEAIEYLLLASNIDIRIFESLCPGIVRRTPQRDLKAMEAKGIIRQAGETNKLIYKLTKLA